MITGNGVSDFRVTTVKAHAKSPFSKLGPATEREVWKENAVKDERMERLLDAWNAVKYQSAYVYPEYNYSNMLKALGDFHCTQAELDAFYVILKSAENERDFSPKAGMFISALVNTGSEENYHVSTRGFQKKLEYLGSWNEKDLTIDGDAGFALAYRCRRGTIVLNGNTGDEAGKEMSDSILTIKGNVGTHVGSESTGGTIVVEGSAGFSAGYYMQGGNLTIRGNCGDCVAWNCVGATITVEGNVGRSAGFEMRRGILRIKGNAGEEFCHGCRGGSIHLDGEYESLSSAIQGHTGQIFHKGVQIYPRLD